MPNKLSRVSGEETNKLKNLINKTSREMMGISLLSLNREREEKRKVQDETTWEMLRTISTEAGQMKVLDRIMPKLTI